MPGSTEDLVDEEGIFTGSERPRVIQPASDEMTGCMTLLLSILMPSIKEVCPQFIQAMTLEEIEERINQAAALGLLICLSSDGSSFDATQYR